MAPARQDVFSASLTRSSTIKSIVKLFAVLAVAVELSNALPDDTKVTFEMLYKAATQAYTEERWAECRGLMTRAIEDWDYLREVQLFCRRKCHGEIDSLDLPEDIDDLRFFDKAMRKAYCLLKCRRHKLGDRPHEVDTAIEDKFKERMPYDYLQICSHKMGENGAAVSYAYTYLMGNVGHEVMISNLQYYRSLPGTTQDMFKDLLMEEYKKEFLKALAEYDDENYSAVASILEGVLTEYLGALDDCRLLCEGPFGLSNSRYDMYVAISNHFTSVLRCKEKCLTDSSSIYDKKYPDFLANIYHYLQYCYFKTGDYASAAAAVASYLLLKPLDADMLYNKDFFVQLGADPEYFKPRPETQSFLDVLTYEKKILDFVDTTFENLAISLDDAVAEQVQKTDDVTWAGRPPFSPDQDGNGHSVVGTEEKEVTETDEENPIEREKRIKRQEKAVEWYRSREEGRITVAISELRGNKSERFVADGFATEKECEDIIKLADDGLQLGDGYRPDDPYIHSPNEEFAGMTPGRGFRLASQGDVSPEAVNLLLKLSETARDFMENYFKLKSHLHFTYTHLVCRTAVEGRQEERQDMSHPIHGDNCILKKDGKCLKQPPAFTWRDYSGLLYLNSDFAGGEFIFADGKKNVMAQVKPQCGRLVSFSSGAENLHGVRAVTEGRRCAIAMWFTLDPEHIEEERTAAEREIQKMLDVQHAMSDHSEL